MEDKVNTPKVDKFVAVPDRIRASDTPNLAELAYKMEVGDSVYFAPGVSGRHGLIKALQLFKRKPRVAPEGEGFRVWRVT